LEERIDPAEEEVILQENRDETELHFEKLTTKKMYVRSFRGETIPETKV